MALQALAGSVHFSNGTEIWTSNNNGVTFAKTDAAAAFKNSAGVTIAASGIVGLGYSPSAGYFATTDDGWLSKVTGLGTSNVELTRFKDLGSSTISFDFFGNGNILRGVRGNDLISFDVSSAANAISLVNANTNLNSVPSTARIGNQFFGMTSNGNFYRINDAGNATQIGANNVTGLNGLTVAGGSSNGNYSQMFVAAGFNSGSNDYVRFGSINHLTGAYTQVSQTFVGGNLAGQMGMVMVIPLPQSAAMGLAGLLGMGVLVRARRR